LLGGLPYEPDITLARRNFSAITGKVAPEHYSGIHELSRCDGILFRALVQESLAPVSIIHGYNGYKTESGLRHAFADICEKKGIDAIGSIPSLVISNQYCLVKGNGVPFLGLNATAKDEWVVVFSARHNSVKLILEVIWSKISCHFDKKMPWNDGLYMDSGKPLLRAKAGQVEDKFALVCWFEQNKEEKHLKRDDDNVWEPASLGKAEMLAINIMVGRGGYLPLDEALNEYLVDTHQATLNDVSQNLIMTRLFMQDGNHIRPIYNQTHIVTLDDDTGYASSERDRFDLWCDQNEIPRHYTNIILWD